LPRHRRNGTPFGMDCAVSFSTSLVHDQMRKGGRLMA
jgi:hypothetical protein